MPLVIHREYFGLFGLKVHSAKNQNQLNMLYNSASSVQKEMALLAKYGQYCDRIGVIKHKALWWECHIVKVSSPCSSSLTRAIQRGERVADANVPASNRSARLTAILTFLRPNFFSSTRPKPPKGSKAWQDRWARIQSGGYILVCNLFKGTRSSKDDW